MPEFILPAVKDADEITLEPVKLFIPDMREVDYLAQVKLKQEDFILRKVHSNDEIESV